MNKNWKDIPKCYSTGNDIDLPHVDDVGDLIARLEKLPKSLPILCGFSDGAFLRITNLNRSDNPHLELCDEDDRDVAEEDCDD